MLVVALICFGIIFIALAYAYPGFITREKDMPQESSIPTCEYDDCTNEAVVRTQMDMSPLRYCCMEHFDEHKRQLYVGGYSEMWVASIYWTDPEDDYPNNNGVDGF